MNDHEKIQKKADKDEKKPRQVQPEELLGSGMAKKAADELKGRKAKLDKRMKDLGIY